MVSGHKGGCLCGAIRYRTAPHSGNAYVCNCHFCQRMTGGPYLVEHCFQKPEIEILRGTCRTYTHVSTGSGKEVYLHFCGDCGSHLFMTFQRFEETMNTFTATLDDSWEVSHGPEALRYLFVEAAQSATVTPAGFEAFDGHCSPADGSEPSVHVFDHHMLCDVVATGEGPHGGRCLCGDIRFEASGAPVAAILCHCRSCLKFLGSGVNHELLYAPENVRHLDGDPQLYSHKGGSGQDVHKRFCGRCGTSVWLTGDRFDEVGLFRGTLDAPNRITPGPQNAMQYFLEEAMPNGMVLSGIPAFRQHRRAPDNSINPSVTYALHWRVADGPPSDES